LKPQDRTVRFSISDATRTLAGLACSSMKGTSFDL
jgi:hypothetical protein